MGDVDGDEGRGENPQVQSPSPRRITPIQWVLLDLVLVVAAGAIGQYAPPVQAIKYGGALIHTLVYALWFAVSVAFLFRRRNPRRTLVLLLVLLFVGLCVRSPAPATIYLPFVLYSVVVTSQQRPGMISSEGVFAAAATLVVAVGGLAIGGSSVEVEAILDGAAAILIGWLAGEYVRNARGFSALRAEFAADKAAAAEAMRADQVSRAVADERVKLARELHDVVAHGMSLVAVRAGVARMVMETQPEQAREALAIIETTTRRTLQEMRLLVGVLRRDRDQEADREPPPGLDNLPRLITDTELAGLDIDLSVRGQARPLSPALDLSAYRIVQEALTNASRHAGPTRARITLDYRPQSIDIDIRDDGPRPGFTPDPGLHPHGTGHGLIGIRERAALFGGTCTVGPLGPGYQVHATLKTTEMPENPITDAPSRSPKLAAFPVPAVTQQSTTPTP